MNILRRQHLLIFILCSRSFASSPTNRLWDTDHRDQDPGGCGDQMCDILWQSQDNNEILEPERARNCCCDAVWRNWPSLIHHILCEKRMWWDSQRFVKKCDIDVTAAWQQVPTASEHYWSIVWFSWRGSFCRQPRIIVTRGERPWHWHRPEREKDCCRVFENLDQEIVDDDKGFFYWEVTPNMKDDAGDQLIMDWPPLIFSRCFNKWLGRVWRRNKSVSPPPT